MRTDREYWSNYVSTWVNRPGAIHPLLIAYELIRMPQPFRTQLYNRLTVEQQEEVIKHYEDIVV